MQNRKKLILLLVAIAVIGWIIRDVQRVRKRGKVHFDSFYQSDIRGRVETVNGVYKNAAFTLMGLDSEFVFHPYTNKQMDEGQIFTEFVEKRDSVFKPSYSDTLILVKQGKLYFIHFTSLITSGDDF